LLSRQHKYMHEDACLSDEILIVAWPEVHIDLDDLMHLCRCHISALKPIDIACRPFLVCHKGYITNHIDPSSCAGGGGGGG
jgi:hypothetical protein